MIQLRWLRDYGTTTKEDKLQFRFEALPGIMTDWEDVPVVVEEPPTASGEQK